MNQTRMPISTNTAPANATVSSVFLLCRVIISFLTTFFDYFLWLQGIMHRTRAVVSEHVH